jgi:hypothetical protein
LSRPSAGISPNSKIDLLSISIVADCPTMEDEGVGGEEEAVRVFVRIRPLNKREIAEKQTIGWNFNETAMLEDTPNGQRVYAYDHCFGPNGTNQETYDIVGKPVVLKAMEGYNGTVFTCKNLSALFMF